MGRGCGGKQKEIWRVRKILSYTNANTLLQSNKNRRQAAEINKYARGELDWLEIVEAKKWNAFGILAMVIGLVSSAFALLLGDVFGRGSDEEKDR